MNAITLFATEFGNGWILYPLSGSPARGTSGPAQPVEIKDLCSLWTSCHVSLKFMSRIKLHIQTITNTKQSIFEISVTLRLSILTVLTEKKGTYCILLLSSYLPIFLLPYCLASHLLEGNFSALGRANLKSVNQPNGQNNLPIYTIYIYNKYIYYIYIHIYIILCISIFSHRIST